MKLLALVIIAAVVAYSMGVHWAIIAICIVLLLAAVSVVSIIVSAFRSDDSAPRASVNASFQRSDETPLGIKVSAHIKISYTDFEGAVTEREVLVDSYDPDSGMIAGRCLLRNARRSFRLERIRTAVDMKTGELLPVTRMRSWLRKQRVSA